MTPSLRLFFTCSLLAASLTACGDDGKETDTNATEATSTDATSTTAGTTTDTPTTDATTTDATTAGPTTTTDPGTTTDDATTGPGTTTDATTGPGTTDATTDGGGLSWAVDVYPMVIGANCGCHNLGSGGLMMNDPVDSYANLVGVDSTEAAGFKRVAPGDPANSYLVAKLKGVGSDPPFNAVSMTQMPLGAGALPPDVIATVEQWIAEGALP